MSQTIGSLWRKQSKNGLVYMSGVLHDLTGDINIAVFVNDKKEKDNQPDFRIVRSEEREKRQQQPANASDPFFGSVPSNDSSSEVMEDEIKVENIPF